MAISSCFKVDPSILPSSANLIQLLNAVKVLAVGLSSNHHHPPVQLRHPVLEPALHKVGGLGHLSGGGVDLPGGGRRAPVGQPATCDQDLAIAQQAIGRGSHYWTGQSEACPPPA